jgi:hypothetical protein
VLRFLERFGRPLGLPLVPLRNCVCFGGLPPFRAVPLAIFRFLAMALVAGFSNAQDRVTRNNIVVLPDDDRIDKTAPTNDCQQLIALFIRVRAAFRFVRPSFLTGPHFN